MQDVSLGLGSYIHPEHNDKPPLEISLVPNRQIKAAWPKVGAMLKRATDMSEGRYSIIDLYEKLVSGEFNLWVAFEPDLNIVAAITSTFTYYPKCKSLHGQFLGGDRLEDWQDKFLEMFHRWGRENRCQFVEFTGRAGWKKQLAPDGYREVYRVYQKDLT